MNKYVIIVLLLLTSAGLYAVEGINKLDPQLGLLVTYPQRLDFLQPDNSLQKTARGAQVRAIVTFQGDVHELQAYGVKIECIYKNLAVVTIPVAGLDKVAGLPQVIRITASRPDYACLDVSAARIGAVKVREQFGYTGKGVLIGIIDSGIDWENEDFIDAAGKTRIKYLLDMSDPGNVYGGTMYTEDDINNALNGNGFVYERDYSGHGTHVAGIAAGDGSADGTFGAYAGVAPEAGLIIIKATRDEMSQEFQTADQIIALKIVDSLATVLNMPCVINMSFGGHSGAHNGTSDVELAIDQVVGPGKSGKAVVTVAGNDGGNNIHARAQFSNGITYKDVTFTINEYMPKPGAGNDRVLFNIWYQSNQKVGITITTPSGKRIGPVMQGEVTEENTDEGTVYVWNGFYEAVGGYLPGYNKEIGNYEIYVDINDANALKPPVAGTWKMKFSGQAGDVDAWITGVTNASMKAAFVEGNVNDGKISIPGTARNVITVGAYTSKKSWVDLDGNHLTFDPFGQIAIGTLASFTSFGPTLDKRIKPEIVAPGEIIASSYSQYAPPGSSASIFSETTSGLPNALILEGGREALSSGTSMAAPHVSGAVALIFEKYPDITAIQVRDMLTNSADTEYPVEKIPNGEWGWGKLDIFSALQHTPGEELPVNFKLFNIWPNPFVESAEIKFMLPVKTSTHHVEIKIYNVLGQLVRNLMNENKVGGQDYLIKWDGRDDAGYSLACGIYFVEFRSGIYHKINKITYLGSQL
ncbi:MAG TPA: S8 family serine peptidase [bacterium]|nr:S8 family serine peptidase [bacterium]HPN45174.1 S8 family serine peptidase [bacterium]